MNRDAVLFVPGLLFGTGLAISGMTNPAKVIGFLDVAGGSWDAAVAESDDLDTRATSGLLGLFAKGELPASLNDVAFTRKPMELEVYLQNHGAQGPSAARNVGLAQASGRYIAFLESDDEWDPAHVAQCVALLEPVTEDGFVYRERSVRTQFDNSLQGGIAQAAKQWAGFQESCGADVCHVSPR